MAWQNWEQVHTDDKGNEFYYRRNTRSWWSGGGGAQEYQVAVKKRGKEYNTEYGELLHSQAGDWDDAQTAMNHALEGIKAKNIAPEETYDEPSNQQRMTQETWMAMSQDDKAQWILDNKYGGSTAGPDGLPNTPDDYNLWDIKEDLQNAPMAGAIDETKKGFIEEGYDLGVSAAGRRMEAAQESFGLAMSGAKRGLESGLGQLQQGAGQIGTQMRGVYGGMGSGMRGAIGGQQSLTKGLESTYGTYTDQQTAATGALGRAKGALQDEMTRLDLGRRESIYGLEKEAEGQWESDWTTFLAELPPATNT